MHLKDIPEIERLSVSEKILLVEELWDEISSDESNVTVPKSHKNELDKRMQRHQTKPGDLLSLDELQERLAKRK